MGNTSFRCAIVCVGSLVGIAHIGIVGHLINHINRISTNHVETVTSLTKEYSEKYSERPQYPDINLPTGKYSSYDVNVNTNGYNIRYNANDPKVMVSGKGLELDKNSKGLFNKYGSEKRSEWRRDEYTMDGYRNLGTNIINGGESENEAKLSAKQIECIKAEGGAESQGAMIGSSIAAGVAPSLIGIPYIGWLATGWATILGRNVGSTVGSEVSSVFNDC